MMQTHKQRGDRSTVWFDGEVTDAGDGTITVQATSFWLHGAQHGIPTYSPSVGSAPFRLYVESTAGGADYLLDTTGLAEPARFGRRVGAPCVVWREEEGGEIHVLRSNDDA